MKKLTIIAALAMATAAFALPSTASAVWTENHQHIPAGVNPQIHTEGEFGYASPNGSIHCTQVTMTVQLTGGQTTGHVNQFTKINPQVQCHTEGALGHCTVTATQPTNLPWLSHINGTTGVQVTGFHLHGDLHGFLCPDLTIHLNDPMDFVELTGEEPGKTGGHTTIQGTDVEGTVTVTPIGTVQITGTFTPTAGNSARYGWT
jgi:hypothetical protein